MHTGDLVFYPSAGRWYERVIVKATHGPYVHVAVALDATHVIAAETWGIRYELLPPDPAALVVLPLTPASKDAASGALFWLNAQLGKRYGWLDIVDQGLRLLGSPFYLGQTHSLDCSDLAACFAALYTNDRRLMTLVLDHRQEISPNDLARYYGLLKGKATANPE
jgi:hypothetical protein